MEQTTPTHETVLAEVREIGPVTVKQLVESTGFPESNVRRALHRLEKEGHVVSDNYQRRGRGRVYLTEDMP